MSSVMKKSFDHGRAEESQILGEKNLGDQRGEGMNISPIRRIGEPNGYGHGGNNPLNRSKLLSTKFQPHGDSILSPPKKKKGRTNSLLEELLGAGSDPLDRNQDFARLTANPGNLMNAKFTKPAIAKVRYPPVIDQFARTIAAPIAATKFSLSVSARVASNYTPSAKYFHIDTESKGIKYIKVKENKVNLTANPEFLNEPATVEEELYYVIHNYPNIPELRKRVEARATSFNRYRQYIMKEINVDCVATIKQYWINDILDLIPSEYQYLDRYTVENMIDKMLHEINLDYYESVRKAILDYVLKDEDERMRLGIMQIISPPVDYGDNIYQGLEPDQEWKDMFAASRKDILDHLVICSRATLQFKEIWSEYEKQLLVELPTKEDQTITIADFFRVQEDRIQAIKEDLQKWVKTVQEIYKTELTDMDKKTAFIFFESNAALMYNQLRGLITDSLYVFRDFFRRFKKESYKDPATIIAEEKDWTNPIEDVFLVLEMKDEDGQILFNTPLSEIKISLLRIIDMIINVSHNFSRAEISISRSDKSKLWEVLQKDEVVQNVAREIEGIIDANLAAVAKVEDVLEKYAYILTEGEVVDRFCEEINHTRKEYEQMIEKYEKIYQEVMDEVPFFIRMSMINIDVCSVKKKLLENCREIIEKKLVISISHIVTLNSQKIIKEIEMLREDIKPRADSVDKLVELEAAIERIKKVENSKIKNEFEDLYKWLLTLVNTPYELSDEEIHKVYEIFKMVSAIPADVELNENRIRSDREALEEKLKQKREDFKKSLDNLAISIEKLKDYATIFEEKEANDHIDSYLRKLREAEIEAEDIGQKEEKIGWTVTEFPQLSEASVKLNPYADLWRLVRDFESSKLSWTKDKPVLKLDPDEVESETKRMKKKATELTSIFKSDTPHPLKLAKEMRSSIEEFEKHTPLVRILCNPGLKPRHWERISKIAQEAAGLPNFGPENPSNLENLMGLDLIKEKVALEEVAEAATKEYNIEKALFKMDDDWSNVYCLLKSWKDTGTYVIQGESIDEIQLLLDDQFVRIQTMKGSQFAKAFEKELEEMENFLQYTQNIIEYWIKVQGVWLYLEPVFSSDDIMKQMPTEGAKFKEVDSIWKMMMSKIHTNPKIKEVTKNKKLLDQLKEANEGLEVVQKGLNSYLEKKRSYFPRFFFLSDQELLEILSETKDPLRVQPHLKKCFEGINKLEFDELKKIQGMYSSEGEYVKYNLDVDAMAAKGAVEQWLIQVEDQMIASLRDVIEVAYNDYRKKKRNEWVLSRCGQAVLAIDMTYWTLHAEATLKEGGAAALSGYKATLDQQVK